MEMKPPTNTTLIPPQKNQAPKAMWPFNGLSLHAASLIADFANIVLLTSLVLGVIATFFIVQTTNVKEHSWDIERKEADERIARLSAEGKQASLDIALATTRGDQAKADAARANARAEELEASNLEIRTRLAPRRVTPEQHKILVKALVSLAPSTVDVEVMGDAESAVFADDITKTLVEGGWRIGQTSTPLGVVWIGLVVFKSPDPNSDRLVAAFQAAKIPVFWGDETRPRATIMIGAKPSAF